MKDLLIEDNDIVFSEDGDVIITDSVAQNALIRLRWIEGEWKYDTELGMPYFTDFGEKNPDLEYIQSIIETEMYSIDGVDEFAITNLDFNKAERTLNISFVASKKDGTVEEKEVDINV